jgi:hypothetical protein
VTETVDTSHFNFNLDITRGVATFPDGLTIPITDWFDQDFEFTLDHEEAVYVCLALPPDNITITIDLSDFASPGECHELNQ